MYPDIFLFFEATSPVHGTGMFTRVSIPKGTLVPFLVTEVDLRETPHPEYCFESSRNHGWLPTFPFYYMNNSRKPNAKVWWDEDSDDLIKVPYGLRRYQLEILENIGPKTEILIDYRGK